jgi:hypothetical protein
MSTFKQSLKGGSKLQNKKRGKRRVLKRGRESRVFAKDAAAQVAYSAFAA